MSILELRRVVKQYAAAGETINAVNDVSLSIEPGEFVALYGPSGSGSLDVAHLARASRHGLSEGRLAR